MLNDYSSINVCPLQKMIADLERGSSAPEIVKEGTFETKTDASTCTNEYGAKSCEEQVQEEAESERTAVCAALQQ